MGILYNKLVSFGLLTEMNDWKSHFINGTKGMPKTEPGILNYVENLLKRSYDGNEERAKNNPIAPWLVMTVKEIGPENINTATLNKIKNVVEYFKATGSFNNLKAHRNQDGTYNVTPLDQASEYAAGKLEKIRQKAAQAAQGQSDTGPKAEPAKKEEPTKKTEPEKIDGDIEEKTPPKAEIPLLEAEIKGRIERVWTAQDGTERIWVKVIDPSWLTELCGASHADKRNWGVMCQATDIGKKFRDGSHTNYQLIGPAKNKKIKEYSTIIGMAVKNSTGLIAELKQEGNVQPGAQKTSGGWSDADKQAVEFLAFSSAAKNEIKGFGTYSGDIPKVSSSAYGGDAFLEYLINSKVDLFNELIDARPDFIETNNLFLKDKLGSNWLDERIKDISEIVEKRPLEFISKFDYFLKKFGREATDALNNLDIESLAKKNSKIILESLGSLVGNLSQEKFDKLIQELNIQDFITKNTDSFKSLIKNMANIPEYQGKFKEIINNNSLDIIKAFGNGGVGIFKFLQFAASPRLRQHQSAVLDPISGEYYGTRDVVINPGEGHENRIVKKQKFVVPDNLKLLTQKERRDFIYKHKDYIASLTPNFDQKSKEINFLRFLFSESNPQDITRTLQKEREDYINFYDAKFKSGEVKKVKLADGTTLESPYLPGIFEFYSALNKRKPGFVVSKPMKATSLKTRRGWWSDDNDDDKNITYYKIDIKDVKKYTQNIVKYYYTIRKNASKKTNTSNDYTKYNPEIQKAKKSEAEDAEAKVRFETAKDYLYTMQLAGASDEEVLEEMKNNFTPDKMRADPRYTIKYYLENIVSLFDEVVALQMIRSLEKYCNALGHNGEVAYKNVLSSLYKTVYLVKPGDTVQYVGAAGMKRKTNSEDYGKINLTTGRKYYVLDVRNSGVVNGEILVIDEGSAEETIEHEYNRGITTIPARQPQERWLGSYLFEIQSIKVLPDELQKYEVNGGDLIQEIRTHLRKRIKVIAERLNNKKRIAYTGIILDKKSNEKLCSFVKEMKKAKKISIPDDWKFSANHITINMGPAHDEELVGQQVSVKVLTYAYDDNVVAVGVNPGMEIEIEKENPHITIAFNALGGARPVMSNKLTNWKPVPKSFVLTGTIQQVYAED